MSGPLRPVRGARRVRFGLYASPAIGTAIAIVGTLDRIAGADDCDAARFPLTCRPDMLASDGGLPPDNQLGDAAVTAVSTAIDQSQADGQVTAAEGGSALLVGDVTDGTVDGAPVTSERLPTSVPPLTATPSMQFRREAESNEHALSRHPFVGQAYFMAGFVYGHSNDPSFAFDIVGLGIELGAAYLVGPRFPGPRGGWWSGLALQPGLGAYFGEELVRPWNPSTVQSVVMLGGGLVVAYQIFGIGPPGTVRQSGAGLAVGYRIGYQHEYAWAFPHRGVVSRAEGGDVSHGAVLSFVSPRYYPRNDHFGRFVATLSFERLPDNQVDLVKLMIGGCF